MLAVISTKLVEMDDKLEHILSETKETKMENAKLKKQGITQERKIASLEREIKRKNIVIRGVDDKDCENAKQTKQEISCSNFVHSLFDSRSTKKIFLKFLFFFACYNLKKEPSKIHGGSDCDNNKMSDIFPKTIIFRYPKPNPNHKDGVIACYYTSFTRRNIITRMDLGYDERSETSTNDYE
ncbi:hypothetical protein FQA39_LY00432 [Lamprigera yunnana]|nr:hypothetical protein FQA39_LY00432 [Lamprigera yunnana]